MGPAYGNHSETAGIPAPQEITCFLKKNPQAKPADFLFHNTVIQYIKQRTNSKYTHSFITFEKNLKLSHSALNRQIKNGGSN